MKNQPLFSLSKRITKIFLIFFVLSCIGFKSRAVDFIDADEIFEVIEDKSFSAPIVIEFWANWCPGSKVVAPRFGEVSREFRNKAQFFKIDIDEWPEVVEYFNFNMLPCVLALYIATNEDGEKQVFWTGARGEPYLQTHHIREIVKDALEAQE